MTIARVFRFKGFCIGGILDGREMGADHPRFDVPVLPEIDWSRPPAEATEQSGFSRAIYHWHDGVWLWEGWRQ